MKSLSEKRLIKSVKFLSLSMKSINPVQKHPYITAFYACILKIFACMLLLPIKFLISSGICSNPKLSKYVTLLFNAYKAMQWVPILEQLSRFITYASFFILLGRLSLE